MNQCWCQINTEEQHSLKFDSKRKYLFSVYKFAEQNGRHFVDDIFRCIFWKRNISRFKQFQISSLLSVQFSISQHIFNVVQPIILRICRCNAPVILSRFGRYVVDTHVSKKLVLIRLGATLCHDVLRCCHAVATPGPRYCPVTTRLTSDTGKFSYVVLR